MKFKSYFNISHLDPGVQPICSIDQDSGEKIDAIVEADDHAIILNGYLDAADLVVSNCTNNKRYVNLDNLLFPVLFLYVSIIEFCLKIILTKLNEHIDSGCPFLQSKNKLSTSKEHKLKKLLDSLDKFYENNRGLPPEHVLKDMELLKHVVSQFEQNEIESVKLRYITNHSNQLYEIYKKGFTCDFKTLHKNIKKIVDNTINYIGSFDLIFCSTREYTPSRHKELEKVHLLMQKFSKLTINYRKDYYIAEQNIRKKKINAGEDPDGFLVTDLGFLPDDSDYYSLESFNDNELSLLVVGVYFNQYPWEPLAPIEYFEDWSREQKIRKVNERVLNIDNGIENLKKHMQIIKELIS